MDLALVLDVLRSLLREGDVAWRDVREGIAIDFSDGCDMLLVDAKAVAASEKKKPDETAEALWVEFQRLDAARTQVLIALRHWARRQKIALQRNQSGDWGVQHGICSSSLTVGARLTQLLRDLPPGEALQELLQLHLLPVPSQRRTARLLANEAPPADELSISDEPLELDSGTTTVFCDLFSVLGDPDFNPTNLEDLQETLERKQQAPGAQVTRQLKERLAGKEFHIDFCSSKRTMAVPFDDEQDNFRFHAEGPAMQKLLKKHGGVAGVVDYLASEYGQLNERRREALHLVDGAMVARGHARDVMVMNDGWHYGTTHQQFRWDPGQALTRQLRRHTPQDVVLRWCEAQNVEPKVTSEELDEILRRPKVSPVQRTLPLVPIEEGPRVRELGELDIGTLDRIAADWLETFRRCADRDDAQRAIGQTDPLYLWEKPEWYQRGADTWVDDAWWIAQARRIWRSCRERGNKRGSHYLPEHQAALILLAYGEDEPRDTLLAQFRPLEFYHHEAIEEGMAWLLEEDLPWTAEEMELDSFPRQLGKVPVKLARQISMGVRDEMRRIDAEEFAPDADGYVGTLARLDRESAQEWLTPQELERARQACLAWAAKNDNGYEFWSHEPLEVAAIHGWPEVVDCLAENSVVAPSLLQWDMSRMHLGTFAQWLSLVKPGKYAARWAAHVLLMDIEAEAAATAESIRSEIKGGMRMSNMIDIPSMAETFHETHINNLRLQKIAAAVAWHRCREAGVGV